MMRVTPVMFIVILLLSGTALCKPVGILRDASSSDGSNSVYYLGAQGDSCTITCLNQGLNCNPLIVTGNSTNLFQNLGVKCSPNTAPWTSLSQPSYISDASNPNFGQCVGFVDVPAVQCLGSDPSSSRLCRCEEPSASRKFFGNGYSQGYVGPDEQFMFAHVLAPGDVGVMTHFWVTYPPNTRSVLIKYYVDGEDTASIQFEPGMAAGVGFDDTQAPWGTKWFGKGAADGSYFFNFRIPFQKSILVSLSITDNKTYGGYYMIVRGATNLPISVGGVTLTESTRLIQTRISALYKPLEWIVLADIPRGVNGAHFLVTVSVASGNLNFLEGCFHGFTGDQPFPGTVLSTGGEDYFDSGWYFNAGEFHMEVSGMTHYNYTDNQVSLSAYRFHDMDPLFFDDGFQLVWRNGDSSDAAGMKCLSTTTDRVAGNPQPSQIDSYAWTYVWKL